MSIVDELPLPLHVVTHSETFHCDEVMAATMLELLVPTLTVVRTRDEKVLRIACLEPSTAVVDVGREYNPDNLQFDHHQESFTDTFGAEFNIPLSSCGLIYRHYGRRLIAAVANNTDQLDMEYLYKSFYRNFILSIDAGDNGVDYSNDKQYNPIVLPAMVSRFNGDNVHDSSSQDALFHEAMDFCKIVLLKFLKKAIRSNIRYNVDLPIFKAGLDKTPAVCLEKGVLVLSSAINVRAYLSVFDPMQHYKYILAPRDKGTWNIWTVNVKGTLFETLAPIISKEDAVSLGIPEEHIIFVHKSGFCGVTTNQSTAMLVALASIDKYNEYNEYEPKSKSDNLERIFMCTMIAMVVAPLMIVAILRGNMLI